VQELYGLDVLMMDVVLGFSDPKHRKQFAEFKLSTTLCAHFPLLCVYICVCVCVCGCVYVNWGGQKSGKLARWFERL
jgi:hypothetical protein